MTWADFYLICFVVGFALSVISFLGGFLHLPGLHHAHGHHVHVGHGHAHGHTGTTVSPFNFFTFAAFLTWFGGAGYLLTKFSSLWLSFGFLIAVALVRPSRSILDVEVKSVKKKWKDKTFAAPVKREEIEHGAARLDVTLDQHIQIVLDAMKGCAEQLGFPPR